MIGRMLLVFSMMLSGLVISQEAEAYAYDDAVSRCKIVEVLRRGQRESNKFIIRTYNKGGRVLETLRAHGGEYYDGRSEAELGLFLLVEEGTCPP